MEYGRLVVLGYSSYRVASSTRSSKTTDSDGTGGADGARSPRGVIGVPQTKQEKDRRTIGQLWEPIGDQNAEYVLAKRKSGNGVKIRRFHHFVDARLRDPKAHQSEGETALLPPSGKSDLKTVTRRMLHAIEIRNKALQPRTLSSSSSEDDDAASVISPSASSTPSLTSLASSASLVSSASSASLTDISRSEMRSPPPSTTTTSGSATYLMCVPMNDTDAHASVTEYVADDTTDMFQIGRMPCRQNDVVIPGPRVGASGTISRFAARIVCRRDAPYECRLYAGGFDVGRKMTTAGHALKRCSGCATWLKRLPANHTCVHTFMDDVFGNNQQEPSAKHPQREGANSSTVLDLDHVEMELDAPATIPVDGLTKNGVRVYLPDEKKWYEVSVNGNLYGIAPRTPSISSMSGRNSSVVNPDTSVRHSAFNRPTGGVATVPALLTDGAIIDLGGVQLQFQAPRRGHPHPTEDDTGEPLHAMLNSVDFATRLEPIDASVASKMDKLNVHCPVQLHPLRFDRGASEDEIESDQVPHVFPACGHVFGFDTRIATAKLCPLCRTPGNLVRLRLKENFQLMPRAERTAVPECVFNPCGHAISNKLAAHYAALVMPNGRAICPFCAVHLDATTPFSRLFLFSEAVNQGDDQ